LSESLNLTNDAMLVAISCILQGYLSPGDMMELMAGIITDIKTDGKLDNMALGKKLFSNAVNASFSFDNILNNMTTKYAELGLNVNIPNFESYVQSFIDSKMYSQEFVITYPATGLHGDNILSDAVTSVELLTRYSMRADISHEIIGSGLKIRIVCESKGTYIFCGSGVGWGVGGSGPIFEFFTSQKRNDIYIQVSNVIPSEAKDYFTIEYYEDGSTTPTKTKKVQILN